MLDGNIEKLLIGNDKHFTQTDTLECRLKQRMSKTVALVILNQGGVSSSYVHQDYMVSDKVLLLITYSTYHPSKACMSLPHLLGAIHLNLVRFDWSRRPFCHRPSLAMPLWARIEENTEKITI